jgi:hypothetical protein
MMEKNELESGTEQYPAGISTDPSKGGVHGLMVRNIAMDIGRIKYVT